MISFNKSFYWINALNLAFIIFKLASFIVSLFLKTILIGSSSYADYLGHSSISKFKASIFSLKNILTSKA